MFFWICELFVALGDAILRFWVLNIFFLLRKNSKIYIHIIWIIALMAISLIPSPLSELSSVLGVIWTFVYAVICFEGSKLHKLLVVWIFNIYHIILSIIYSRLLTMVFKSSFAGTLQIGSKLRFLIIVFIYGTLFGSVYLISKFRKPGIYFSKSDVSWLIVLFGCDFMIMICHSIFLSWLPDCIFVQIAFFLSVSLLVGINLIIVGIIYRLNIQGRQTLENQLLKFQIDGQISTMAGLKEQEQKIRTIRHDMKNILLTYQTLLEGGQTEKVISNIRQMIGEYLNPNNILYTDNYMFQTILSKYSQQWQENGISQEVNCSVSNKYQDVQFSVIIQNLLDNATEAELKIPEKDRKIIVDVIERETDISLLIRNYIIESVLESNPMFNTTKLKPSMHGLGMKSVKNIIKQHGGILDIYEENSFLGVHVIFPIFDTL